MDDRELLELAAKAANQERSAAGDLWSNVRGALWNPLTDDGDALRLAVKLGMFLDLSGLVAEASAKGRGGKADYYESSKDKLDASRRAIVIAAAEIGRAM